MNNLDSDYNLDTQAKIFLINTLKNDQILMSAQLLNEIYHVTTTRGLRIPSTDVMIYLNDILTKENIIFIPTTIEDVKRCFNLSSQYNTHIWDFMVVIPFENDIDIIYTMDPHFQNSYFKKIAIVENPLGVWKVEGKK